MKHTLTHKEQSARKLIISLHDDLGSWRAVSERLKINKGYLSAIAREEKKPSAKVIAAVGLHPDHVIIAVKVCPLCGAVPKPNHRCPQAAPKYAPHPVMRLSKIRRILQSRYNNS